MSLNIFAIWPTDADLAREIGMSYSTVSAWKQRGSIPVAYWRAILDAAHRRGHPELTADLLVELHAGASGDARAGFAEDDAVYKTPPEAGDRGDNQTKPPETDTSRVTEIFAHHFKTADEIEEHIRALREEWSHRSNATRIYLDANVFIAAYELRGARSDHVLVEFSRDRGERISGRNQRIDLGRSSCRGRCKTATEDTICGSLSRYRQRRRSDLEVARSRPQRLDRGCNVAKL